MTDRQAIQHATEITLDVLHTVRRFLQVGMTEKEIAALVEDMLISAGGEKLAFPVIAALTANAAEPHHVPTDRRAKKGDLLVLDIGCTISGMRSDMTRTLFFGKPQAQHKRWYNDVLEAQQCSFRGVRAGRTGQAVDAIARRYLDEQGYTKRFVHSLGHGVGKRIHQKPWITPGKRGTNVLKRGDIITIEPGIYFPGKGGIRIEDMCEVGAKKGKWLVSTQRHISRMIIT